MDSSQLFTFATIAYLVAMVLYISYLAFRIEGVGKAASYITYAGLGLQTIALGMRWVESYQMGFGHAPLSNMYESLVFFSWCIALIYLLVELRLKSRIIGVFAMPLSFLAIAYAALAPGVSDRIDPLIPALQSNWLHAHVITCFLSYASFAISFGLSIMYLIKAGKKEGRCLRTAERTCPISNRGRGTLIAAK